MPTERTLIDEFDLQGHPLPSSFISSSTKGDSTPTILSWHPTRPLLAVGYSSGKVDCWSVDEAILFGGSPGQSDKENDMGGGKKGKKGDEGGGVNCTSINTSIHSSKVGIMLWNPR